MNQTEMLMKDARNDADRALIEFGYDPWQIESFLRVSPVERLRTIKRLHEFGRKGRASLAASRK